MNKNIFILYKNTQYKEEEKKRKTRKKDYRKIKMKSRNNVTLSNGHPLHYSVLGPHKIQIHTLCVKDTHLTDHNPVSIIMSACPLMAPLTRFHHVEEKKKREAKCRMINNFYEVIEYCYSRRKCDCE